MLITENLILGSSCNPANVFLGSEDSKAIPVAAVAVSLMNFRLLNGFFKLYLF